MKECQLDMHMKLWNHNQVKSLTLLYLILFFMGHDTAVQMYEKIEKRCSGIGFQNLIHLSMDGPNVNWKTFSLAQHNIEEHTDCYGPSRDSSWRCLFGRDLQFLLLPFSFIQLPHIRKKRCLREEKGELWCQSVM